MSHSKFPLQHAFTLLDQANAAIAAARRRIQPHVRHTPVLRVPGEELGLAGVCALIFIYFWVVQRCFSIGRRAIQLDRVFSGLFAQGIGLWIGVQAIINMGVNMGVLPTKGLTLPLMSFGGSAIAATLIAIAILLRIDWEGRQIARGFKV